MSISLASIKDQFDKVIGDYRQVVTDSAGGAGTIIASALQDFPDDFFAEDWAEITSGTANTQIRQCSDFVSSGGSVILRRAYSVAPGSGATIKMHNIDPVLKEQALADACRETFPALYKLIVDDTLVTGNILINSNFEDFLVSTIPDGFVNGQQSGTTITPTQDTTTKRYGASSLKCVVTGDSTLNCIYQSETENGRLLDIDGGIVPLHGWCRADVASQARLALRSIDKAGTSTISYSSYHSGGGYFEKLELSDAHVIEGAVEVDVRLMCQAAGTIHWDNSYLPTGTYEFNIPSQFTVLPEQVWMDSGGADEVSTTVWSQLHNWTAYDDNGTFKLRVSDYLAKGYKLRLVGRVPLVLPSSASGTLNIGTFETQRLITQAAVNLYERLIPSSGGQDVTGYERQLAYFKTKLKGLSYVKMQPVSQHLRQWE